MVDHFTCPVVGCRYVAVRNNFGQQGYSPPPICVNVSSHPDLLPRLMQKRLNNPVQHHTVEDSMTQPAPLLPPFPDGVFTEFVDQMNRQIAQSRLTPEREFQALEAQVGDRVRLTQVTNTPGTILRVAQRRVPKDAAVLEGNILGIKVKNGKTQLRITGFDHTGPSRAGGQNVWFPVEDYRVEVLHKVYRMTDEDRLIAAVANVSEDRWIQLTDEQRETRRRDYGDRAERVKRLLQGN